MSSGWAILDKWHKGAVPLKVTEMSLGAVIMVVERDLGDTRVGDPAVNELEGDGLLEGNESTRDWLSMLSRWPAEDGFLDLYNNVAP